ncbi:MAG: matrixin family metalloprotease, partial [Thermodesulfobacteriota bacterium]|nr:matrixin family metalloprotease [Thermodesulfobacteriota bacterium]
MSKFISFFSIICLVLCLWVPNSSAYSLTGKKWQEKRATFFIKSNISASRKESIRSAMDQLSTVYKSSFRYVYGGTTNKIYGQKDGVNTADFGSLGSGYLGYSMWWYIGSKTIESDVRFNSSANWGVYSLLSVALHELGHSLGLGHSSNKNAIMYYMSNGRTSLHTDDMNGIRKLYPGPIVWPYAVADFNHDGQADLAYVNPRGKVLFTTNFNTWTDTTGFPGAMRQIVAGDFDGDGLIDDLAGVQRNGNIYYTTDLNTWTRITGSLAQVVAGDFDGDGKNDDLAGVQDSGDIYYTTNLTTWTKIAGSLAQMVAGDFDRDGVEDDLAGVQSGGDIYYTTNLTTWTKIA